MGELKPRSFRVDEETAKKFKEISLVIGGNQQETLAKLIETYEFQSGKAVLTEKREDIEQFERYVNILTRMYMNVLEDSQNIKKVVQADFDALLKSKDTMIQMLQDEKEILVNKNKALEEENRRLGLEYDRQLFLLEKDCNNRCDTLEKEYSIEIRNYQIKYKKLLEKLERITSNQIFEN